MARAGVFALVLAAGMALVVAEGRRARVGGADWQRVRASEELRADLVTPAASIMEAYLIALELAGPGADDAGRAARLGRLRDLRDGMRRG